MLAVYVYLCYNAMHIRSVKEKAASAKVKLDLNNTATTGQRNAISFFLLLFFNSCCSSSPALDPITMNISPQATLSSPKILERCDISSKDDPLLPLVDNQLPSSLSITQQHHQMQMDTADRYKTNPTALEAERTNLDSRQSKEIFTKQPNDDKENERSQQQMSAQDKGSRVYSSTPVPAGEKETYQQAYVDNSIVLPASRHTTDTTMTAPYTPVIDQSPCLTTQLIMAQHTPSIDTTVAFEHDQPIRCDDEQMTRLVPPSIQNTTNDVFTEAQKVAFVGLCAVTSLEIVHSFHGNEYAYARMSADNWQRKLMRDIYKHMDVSSTGKSVLVHNPNMTASPLIYL